MTTQTLRRDKLHRAEIKVVDEDKGTVTAVVSSEKVDRDGDIIRVAGWDLKDFLKHPVLMSSHNYRSLLNQIGEWTEMKVVGKRLVGTAQYYIGKGNAEADWGFELAKLSHAAFSVGFIPDMDKAEMIDGSDDWWPSWEFNGQTLLEVSAVTIPSNSDALQRAKSKMPAIVREIADEVLRDDPAHISITGGLTGGGLSLDEVADAIAEKLTPFIANEFRNMVEDLTPDGLKEITESWHRR